ALQLVITEALPAVRTAGPPASDWQTIRGRSNASSTGRVEGQLRGRFGSQRAQTLSHAGRHKATGTDYPNGSRQSLAYSENGRDGGIRTRDLLLPNQLRPVA